MVATVIGLPGRQHLGGLLTGQSRTAHTSESPLAPARPSSPPHSCAAQAETLDAPRLRYSILDGALFTAMDLAYGRTRTIVKFTISATG